MGYPYVKGLLSKIYVQYQTKFSKRGLGIGVAKYLRTLQRQMTDLREDLSGRSNLISTLWSNKDSLVSVGEDTAEEVYVPESSPISLLH